MFKPIRKNKKNPLARFAIGVWIFSLMIAMILMAIGLYGGEGLFQWGLWLGIADALAGATYWYRSRINQQH